MVAGNVAKIIRSPGRLIVNPDEAFSDATKSYPYGGTEVGKTNMCALTPIGSSLRVEYEGLGEAGDILYGPTQWMFSCFLRGWDDDAIQKLRPAGYSLGSVTQHALYNVPGTQIPGLSALGSAVILAYVPDDPIHVPGVMVYRAIPDWTEGADLAFQRGSELGIPLTFDCLRDSNNNILRVGRLDDINLT